MRFALFASLRSTTLWMVSGDFFQLEVNTITVCKGRRRSQKESTDSLKIRSASKRKESELIKIDCWWPALSLKKIKTKTKTKTKTIGKRSLLFEGVQGRGGCTQARLWRFFYFTLNFFLMKFFSRYFLDFKWSTMIYEHFEQDKHQFVWPNVLTKRLVTEKRTILSYLILSRLTSFL